MTSYNFIKIIAITDSNRRSIDFALINNKLEIKENVGVKRIVYEELFQSIKKAEKRLEELKKYTRMQRERTIRKRNPNWLSLV